MMMGKSRECRTFLSYTYPTPPVICLIFFEKTMQMQHKDIVDGKGLDFSAMSRSFTEQKMKKDTCF